MKITGQAMVLADPPVAVDVQIAEGHGLPAGADPVSWVVAALRAAGAAPVARSLSLRLAGRDESRRLNEAYRGQPKPTNVLAFPAPQLPGLPPAEPEALGDLVICMPVLEAEARVQSKPVVAHLAHLVVHGTLHLLGYDHADRAQACRMEALEARALAECGFADPYATEADSPR